MKFYLHATLAFSLWFASTSLRAEKVDLNSSELRDISTHIIVAQVLNIYEQTTVTANWRITKYVAEVRVDKVEKPNIVSPLTLGGLLYVRYWKQWWIGQGALPAGTSGHRGLPTQGATMRIYLARDAYDGFNETKDGGYNVVGANGFEIADRHASQK